jgi:hypothetical protein
MATIPGSRRPTINQLNAQLNRTVLSHDDIGEARQCLETLQMLDPASDAVIRRALLTTAVVAYCRPFSSNESHVKATSQPSVKLHQVFSAAQRELHEKLMDLRNAVAHSDYERRPVSRVDGSITGFSYWGANFDLLQQGLDPGRVVGHV